jgi:hypothetical protein
MRTSVIILVTLVMLGCSVMPVLSQEPAAPDLTASINGYERATHSSFVGVPTDWSTGHLIFSQPAPGSEAEGKVQQDPRYWLQQIQRAQLQSDDSIADGTVADSKKPKKVKSKKVKIKKDWSESLGGAGATVGADSYPAKFDYSTSPGSVSCNDYVVYNTSLPGSSNQASIIAFTDLYLGTVKDGGCGSLTAPTVAWAYNTGGTVATSVTPSFDGTQVAFVHTSASGASLEILRPVNGQGTSATSPVTPGTSSTTGSAYVTCKAGSGSCLLSLIFSGAANDTLSSPYYVFTGAVADSDTIFVGDDSGELHKFTGVFNGTPTEVTTSGSGFPFQAATAKLSGPIYNEVAGTVVVDASYDGTSNGSRLHEISVDIATPSSANSTILGPTTAGTNCAGTTAGGTAFTVDSPLVDPTAGTQGTYYVFIANDGEATPSSAVYQFASGSVGGTCGTTKVTVGAGSTTSAIPVYSGTFDNIYFVSADPTPSGNIYVCGNAGGDPMLYQIPISANTIKQSTVSAGLVLTTGAATCSPVTEFLNGMTDRAYLSVTAHGKTTGPINCPAGGGGCLMSFTLGTAPPTGTSAAIAASGGTSGIVIDNSGTTSGASQVYFSTLTGATAIQAAQAGL